MNEKLIKSPLNYTGGKYKLLPQILPLFPKNISTFVDLFCGGCNVAANIKANTIICNDSNADLIGLLKYFQNTNNDELIQNTIKIIEEYHLSNTQKNGYSFYNCDSANGLGKYNKEKYINLRNYFNSLKNKNSEYYSILYVLIIFAFNNQIRFNSKGEFNLPVGKRDFNSKMQEKIKLFSTVIKNENFTFEQSDFIAFDISLLDKNSFVYVDPPYLITCATYNEKSAWTEIKEKNLLDFLDNLSLKKIKFALSNVLSANGKTNHILAKWLNSNPMYKCYHLDYSYKNSNYHKKNVTEKTDEVLITNY